MVITCPSCAARYRLNPDKVQGRGAKITCPKCSHVFVVFTDQEAGKAAPAPVAAPKVRTPPRPAAPPTHGADKRSATQTGAFRAVGIAQADESLKSRDSKSNARVVAPGPRSTRRVRALSTPSTAAPRGPKSESQPPVAAADLKIGSASELDFRSVGIKTWKVKVAIGLIYDFSDISTLQKYLADKKVTPDDLISHNNADWTRIGDIEDLDNHFVEAWRVAKAAIESGEAEAPVSKKKVSDPAAAAPAAAGSDSFRVDTSRGRSTGNYPAPAPPRRRKAPEPEEEEGGKKRALMALAAVLVFGALAWTFLRATDGPVAGPPPPPIDVKELGPTDAELLQIQEGIRADLERQRAELEREEAANPETPEAFGEPAPRELVPVPPSERRDQAVVQKQPVVTPQQKYTPPPKPKVTEPQQPKPQSTGVVKNSTGKDPAAVYLSAAKKKLAAGDYGSAKAMALKGIGKNSKCGGCYSVLAEAEKQLGNAPAASDATKKAQDLKSPQSLARP